MDDELVSAGFLVTVQRQDGHAEVRTGSLECDILKKRDLINLTIRVSYWTVKWAILILS